MNAALQLVAVLLTVVGLPRRGGRRRRNGATTTLTMWFANADGNRPGTRDDDKILAAELAAMRRLGAHVIAMCEVVSNQLPYLAGMATVGDRRGGSSNQARRNVFAYVDRDLVGRRVPGVRWWDLRRGFPRKHYPGVQPPRSFFRFLLGRVRVFVVHAPPDWDGAGQAREEFVDAVVAAVAPWTRHRWPLLRTVRRRLLRRIPVAVLGDMNGVAELIAERADLEVHGTGADLAMSRNAIVRVERVDEFSDPAGRRQPVAFGGDHGSVKRFDVTVATRWLSPPGAALRTLDIPA